MKIPPSFWVIGLLSLTATSRGDPDSPYRGGATSTGAAGSGGSTSGPASGVPIPPPAPVAEPKMPPWFEAAQKRLDDCKASIEAQRLAVKKEWTSTKISALIEARVLQICQGRGLTESEVAEFYTADKASLSKSSGDTTYGDDLAERYAAFYDHASSKLDEVSVIAIGNYLDHEHYVYATGNQAEVEAALVWLDADMEFYKFYADLHLQQLPREIENAARSIAGSAVAQAYWARARKETGQQSTQDDQIGIQLREHGGFAFAPGPGSPPVYSHADRIGTYPYFYHFAWMAKHADVPRVRSTDPSVSFVETARRIEAHITDLEARRAKAAAQESALNHYGFHGVSEFYHEYVTVLESSLWELVAYNFTVHPADLDRLDANVAAMAEREQEFPKFFEAAMQFEQKTDLLEREEEAISDQEHAARAKANNLAPGADRGAWLGLVNAADDIEARRVEAMNAIGQERADYDAMLQPFSEKLGAEKPFAPVPEGRVAMMWFEVQDEAEPVRSITLDSKLDPRNVWLGETHHFLDVALGAPMVLVVEFDGSLPADTTPQERTIEISAGDRVLNLKLQLQSDRRTYRSQPFHLTTASAPPAETASP
jgi:hypothetical protein